MLHYCFLVVWSCSLSDKRAALYLFLALGFFPSPNGLLFPPYSHGQITASLSIDLWLLACLPSCLEINACHSNFFFFFGAKAARPCNALLPCLVHSSLCVFLASHPIQFVSVFFAGVLCPDITNCLFSQISVAPAFHFFRYNLPLWIAVFLPPLFSRK